MFNFVQNWLAPADRPIGVDFGTDCLRMAQVRVIGGKPRLVAAASADVPSDIRTDPDGRARFFSAAVRESLASGNFRGRQILLALPAGMTSIITVAVSATDPVQAKAKIAAAVGEALAIDPAEALCREIIVAEPNRDRGWPRDVVVIAAPRIHVDQMIQAATQSHLEIVGMNIEPKAVLDCFSHVRMRRNDSTATICIVDIGSRATRLLAARAGQVLGAATISVGGIDFDQAVARAASVSMEEARLQRLKICHSDTRLEEIRDKRELHVVRSAGAAGDLEFQRKVVGHACGELSRSLIWQIDGFRDRISQRFPGHPIDRLIFIGGEAHNRALCRSIARATELSATVGDPLLRMSRHDGVGFESGIDRREPQPAWTVAIGLSLGPAIPVESDLRRDGVGNSEAHRSVRHMENTR